MRKYLWKIKGYIVGGLLFYIIEAVLTSAILAFPGLLVDNFTKGVKYVKTLVLFYVAIFSVLMDVIGSSFLLCSRCCLMRAFAVFKSSLSIFISFSKSAVKVRTFLQTHASFSVFLSPCLVFFNVD